MYKRFASSVAVSVMVCLLVVGALRPTVAHAQWIYESTPSQDFFRNLGEVMVSAAQLHADMQDLSAQIEAARQRYFAAPVGSAARTKAGKEFSKLLDDKDLLYGLLLFQRGPGNDLASLIAQPFIDHGIPAAAGGAYLNWIVAVRRSMGAKADNQFLWNFSAELLGPALKQNLDAYVAYRKIRDQSEIDTWNKLRVMEFSNPPRLGGGNFMAKVDLQAVPEAVKATLRHDSRFEGWETSAAIFTDYPRTRYMVRFGAPRYQEYLLNDKGQDATPGLTPAEWAAMKKRYAACAAEARKLQLGAHADEYESRCQFGPTPPSSAEIAKWQAAGQR